MDRYCEEMAGSTDGASFVAHPVSSADDISQITATLTYLAQLSAMRSTFACLCDLTLIIAEILSNGDVCFLEQLDGKRTVAKPPLNSH